MPNWVLIYIALAIAGALFFRAMTGPFRPPRFLSVVLTRAVVGFAALSPFVVGLVWFALEQVENVPAVLSGALGGTVVAVGWLVAFSLRQFEALEERERAIRDTLLALREEIGIVVERLDVVDLERDFHDEPNAILKGKDGANKHHPFPVSLSKTHIFDSLSSNVALIEDPTIEAVVRFYAAYSDLGQLVEDFRSPEVVNLSAERRARAYRHVGQLRVKTLKVALEAIVAINHRLGDVMHTAIKRSGKNPNIVA